MARRSSSSKPRPSKCKYSALYVACSACNEMPHVDDIADGVTDSVRSETSTSDALPRLTLTVSGKGLKVVRHAPPRPPTDRPTAGARQRRRGSRHSADKVRYSLSDIVVVGQGVETDVRAAVGVVVHGFDSGTSSWLHMHVYWFDDGGPDTAVRFVRQMSDLIETPQHRESVKQLENKMISSGQLRERCLKPPVDFAFQPRPRINVNARAHSKANKYARQRLSAAAAAVYRQPEVEICRQNVRRTSDDCKWPERQSRVNRISCGDFNGGEYIMWSPDPPSKDRPTSRADVEGGYRGLRQRPASLAVPTPVASLASELRERLATGAPILLPPKDYDTVSRACGNLNGIEERRCVNVNIVGGRRRSDSNAPPQTYL